jgi:desulfoferrodoxin-like iron-binding protein
MHPGILRRIQQPPLRSGHSLTHFSLFIRQWIWATIKDIEKCISQTGGLDMPQKNEMYKCNQCGNVVEVKQGGGADLVCCGEPMQLMSSDEAAQYK